MARPCRNVCAMLSVVYCPNTNRSPLKGFQTKGRSRVWRAVDGLIRVSKKSLWLQWERRTQGLPVGGNYHGLEERGLKTVSVEGFERERESDRVRGDNIRAPKCQMPDGS